MLLGIESGNDEILKRCGKGIKTTQVREVVDACHKLRIHTYGSFILGLPGDNPKTIEETISFASSLPLTMAGFNILIPFSGTKALDDFYIKSNEESIDYRQFIGTTGIHFVSGYTGVEGMDLAELPRMISRAQKRFYLRMSQILRMLQNATPFILWGYINGLVSLLKKELYIKRNIQRQNESKKRIDTHYMKSRYV